MLKEYSHTPRHNYQVTFFYFDYGTQYHMHSNKRAKKQDENNLPSLPGRSKSRNECLKKLF